MEKFEVGEVAIVADPNSIYHNQEVTILSPLIWKENMVHVENPGRPRRQGHYHKVDCSLFNQRHPTRKKPWCPVENLRKKRPPREILGDWNAIERVTGWRREIKAPAT